MLQADFFSHNTHPPLRYINGKPVYLATIIVGCHVLVALLSVFFGTGVLRHFYFNPMWNDVLHEPWRMVTWAFATQVSVWLLMGTFFIYVLARRFEMWFGPKFLGALYFGLILTGSVLSMIYYHLDMPIITLSGECVTVTFALFLGTCFMEPDAPFWGIEKFPMKLAGLISLGLGLLGYTAARDWGSILILLPMIGVMYAFLRRTGMPARFGRVAEAFKQAMPARRPAAAAPRLPGQPAPRRRGDAPAAPSRYYEPKIKPKPDLAPERKAVEEIDGILDKIAKSGMDSLTAAEKTALQNASSRLKDTDY